MNISFGFDGWLIAAIMAAVVFIAGAMLAREGYDIYERDSYFNGPPVKVGFQTKKFWRHTLLWLIGLYAVANSMTAAISAGSTDEYATVYAPAAASAMGLDQDATYPLVLGERIDGSSGSVSLGNGWFFARAAVDMQPASALSIGFQSGDKSYILELPTSGVTFVQKVDAQPSVTLHLQNLQVNDAAWDVHYGPCQWNLHNFWLECEKPVVSRALVYDGGLSALVAKNFSSATITLTPETYARVLNGK